MTQEQALYLKIGIITMVSGLLLSVTYRPYVYNFKIEDYGIADTLGSLVSVISFCCLFWSTKVYSATEKNIHILFITFIYAILWEILGLLNIYGTFDVKDIVAGILSGIITYFIKGFVEKK